MKKARLYRMVTEQHICPFGLRSKDLLERQGYEVEDKWLTSREETDAFKSKHDVSTTPQTFIEGERVGGYDDLRAYFGKKPAGPQGTSYQPVIAIFCVSLLLALIYQQSLTAGFSVFATLMLFIGFAMTLLAVQKLQNLYTFTNSFITYDLLAMRNLRYGYAYPFLELYAGLGMLSGISPWLVAPVSVFIGSIGAASVFKAVYVDKRELKCACVGGDSNVPLGFVSLSENLFMVAGGLLMLVGTAHSM